MSTTDIAELASRYWKVLNAAPFDDSHGSLAHFPRQCCQSASYLFAIYLLKAYGERSVVVFAQRGPSIYDRHAWVEVSGVIVDLTCGQFAGEAIPAFYVGAMGDWHAAWEKLDRETDEMTPERAERVLSKMQGSYDLVSFHLADVQ